MAINRSTRYPGRFDDPDAGQPEGAFKNKSGELAVDGSYLEKDWANDWAAFFSSLLNGEAANGTVDEVGASQLFQALIDFTVPVGRVIQTVNNVNPSATYPGTTWESIADGRYIMSVGSFTDPNGDQGNIPYGNWFEGEYLHQLSIAELPVHAHPAAGPVVDKYGTGGGTGYAVGGTTSAYTGQAGGDEKHNNMPPGFALYTWQRTA